MDDNVARACGLDEQETEIDPRIKQRLLFSPKPPDRLYGPFRFLFFGK
jgi:hypothetical protein